MIKKKLIIIFFLLFFISVVLYSQREKLSAVVFAPTESLVEQVLRAPDYEIIAENLEIPWEVAFLPSGEILITERPGRLLKIGADKQIIEVEGVTHTGEGGLLGMVLHPEFESNNWLYLYFTSTSGEGLINRVERYVFTGEALIEKKVIVSDIPGARFHDGGRIEFGPDGYLYIATGDAGNEQAAQNKDSLHGTILRVTDEGKIPTDNPFETMVYSYGHRNVQGLAWDSFGNLWATEHGRSGARSGFDELNLIQPGNNYGWPGIEGDETQSDMVSPILHSGATDTWAPAGMEFYKGKLYFAGLRGEALYEASIETEDGDSLLTQSQISQPQLKMNFREKFGRLRAVRLSPDGFLYITTSNTDGRGQTNNGDDKLIKINLESL